MVEWNGWKEWRSERDRWPDWWPAKGRCPRPPQWRPAPGSPGPNQRPRRRRHPLHAARGPPAPATRAQGRPAPRPATRQGRAAHGKVRLPLVAVAAPAGGAIGAGVMDGDGGGGGVRERDRIGVAAVPAEISLRVAGPEIDRVGAPSLSTMEPVPATGTVAALERWQPRARQSGGPGDQIIDGGARDQEAGRTPAGTETVEPVRVTQLVPPSVETRAGLVSVPRVAGLVGACGQRQRDGGRGGGSVGEAHHKNPGSRPGDGGAGDRAHGGPIIVGCRCRVPVIDDGGGHGAQGRRDGGAGGGREADGEVLAAPRPCHW